MSLWRDAGTGQLAALALPAIKDWLPQLRSHSDPVCQPQKAKCPAKEIRCFFFFTPSLAFCDSSFLSLEKCVSLWDLSSALLL